MVCLVCSGDVHRTDGRRVVSCALCGLWSIRDESYAMLARIICKTTMRILRHNRCTLDGALAVGANMIPTVMRACKRRRTEHDKVKNDDAAESDGRGQVGPDAHDISDNGGRTGNAMTEVIRAPWASRAATDRRVDRCTTRAKGRGRTRPCAAGTAACLAGANDGQRNPGWSWTVAPNVF